MDDKIISNDDYKKNIIYAISFNYFFYDFGDDDAGDDNAKNLYFVTFQTIYYWLI